MKIKRNKRLLLAAGIGLGSVLAYVTPYLPAAARAFVEANDVQVSFLPYDWTLNKAE